MTRLRSFWIPCTLAAGLACAPRAEAPPGAVPPAPAGVARSDPAIVQLIETRRAAVAAAPRDAGRWTALGLAYEAHRFAGAARESYERAVALDPSDARRWYRLAVVRAETGDVRGAVEAGRRVSEAGARYGPAYWRLGSWLLDLNELEPAREAFRQAAVLSPDEPAGAIGVARVALRQGDPQRAAATLRAVLAQHPGAAGAGPLLAAAERALGHADARPRPVAAGVAPAPHDPWTEAVAGHRRGAGVVRDAALAAFRAGRFDEAVTHFERLRRLDPTDFTLLNQLGAAYVAAGRGAEALAVLETLAPDHFETQLNLAGAYMITGDLDRARRHVERAIAISPGHARGHERLGVLLIRAGRHDAARAAFETALDHDPHNLNALLSLAMLHYNRGAGAEALTFFERARRRDPTAVEAYAGAAMVHLDDGALDAAAALIARAAALAPDHPHVRLAGRRLASRRRRADGAAESAGAR